MNKLKKILPWKRTLILSLIVLFLLNIFSYYSLYTNKFYFLKFENYIFPLLSLVHFIFLYVLWFKIKEDEYSDPPMRNLEYILYGIFFIYVFKFINAVIIILSYNDFIDHAIPSTFFPIGILILFLNLLLIMVTILAISYRKQYIGNYNFEELNKHIDNWD